MTEPDVAITDYLLAMECVLLAVSLISQPAHQPDLRIRFAIFFLATGLASFLGGTVHGFFVARPSRLGRLLWRCTLISIGVTASAGWMIAAQVLWGDAHAGWILALVAVELIGYAAVVMAVNDAFWVAMANYAPSTGFLIVAYVAAYQASPNRAIAVGLAGLALTIVAGLGQRLRIGIHPIYFNYNAMFHVLQGIALFMIFWSGRYFIGA